MKKALAIIVLALTTVVNAQTQEPLEILGLKFGATVEEMCQAMEPDQHWRGASWSEGISYSMYGSNACINVLKNSRFIHHRNNFGGYGNKFFLSYDNDKLVEISFMNPGSLSTKNVLDVLTNGFGNPTSDKVEPFQTVGGVHSESRTVIWDNIKGVRAYIKFNCGRLNENCVRFTEVNYYQKLIDEFKKRKQESMGSIK